MDNLAILDCIFKFLLFFYLNLAYPKPLQEKAFYYKKMFESLNFL
jgi:hypothetical protein